MEFILAHSEDKNVVSRLHAESLFIHAWRATEHASTVRDRTDSTVEWSTDGKHHAAMSLLLLLLKLL